MKNITILLLLLAGTQLLAQQRFVQEFSTARNDGAVGVQQVENKEFLMLNQRFGLSGADSFGINLTKMSDLGRLRWSRDYNFDFPVQAGDLAYWPQQNGYLVSASSAVDTVRDHIVARFNTVGGLMWARSLGADNLIQAEHTARTKIALVSDSTFAVAAGAANFSLLPGSNDILLAKLDQNGELLWSRSFCFSCQGNNDALLGDLIQTSDGGFLIGGSIRTEISLGSHWEALLIKTDSEGQLSWVRSYNPDSISNIYQLKALNLAEPKPGQYLWTGDFNNEDSLTTNGVFVLVNASDTIPFATQWTIGGANVRVSTLDLFLQDTSGKGRVVLAGSAGQDTLPAAAREYNFLAAVSADSMQLAWAKDYFPESDAGFTTPNHALAGTIDGGYAYFITIDTQMVNANSVLVKTNDEGITSCEEDLTLALDTLPLNRTNWTVQVVDLATIDTLKLKNTMDFGDIMPTMEGLELTGGGGQSCEPIMELLDATVQEAQNYLWNTGETTPTITVNKEGMFTVEVSSEALCFYLPDTTSVNILPPPMGVAFADQDSLCDDRQALLIANGSPVFSYRWSTGEVAPVITVSTIGAYTVTMTNPCDSLVLTVNVTRLGCECDIDFPNAFTPDNDTYNDRFKPLEPCSNFTEFKLFVYNRWGENVYAGTSQSEGWNGENNGQPVPTDTYVWYATYRTPEGNLVTRKGDVTLVR